MSQRICWTNQIPSCKTRKGFQSFIKLQFSGYGAKPEQHNTKNHLEQQRTTFLKLFLRNKSTRDDDSTYCYPSHGGMFAGAFFRRMSRSDVSRL
ncbi:hypothetical protein PoB_005545800 [Plakobranchus ocellatus]|uniref:Uncharacterized protein n=1 Tax=Plakobranchus ocellatus TaxID=259542 RepID=A0AAV4CBV0_9GAST|nr:hypothetical protein PoB_005545800 [Plakobranchus ocellatus]